jgi:hypothetical protein
VGEGGYVNAFRTSAAEYAGAGVDRGTSGEDVIDQDISDAWI